MVYARATEAWRVVRPRDEGRRGSSCWVETTLAEACWSKEEANERVRRHDGGDGREGKAQVKRRERERRKEREGKKKNEDFK